MSALRERTLFWTLAIVVAATRLFALSHSMWDWDEALFCSALRAYNVASHHPHPPGFPLFIAMGKLVHLVAHQEFHALRGVNLFFSFFVFPAAFAFARSLRFSFRSSLLAALLFSFLPNVWYFGGTGFSDIPCIVFFLAGAALLLRDDRRSTYLAGCALFAASMLIRPQNVLLMYPWLAASWRRLRVRRFGDVVAGSLLIVAMIAIGYGAAAKITGVDDYVYAVKWHQKYVATVDGSFNPHRQPIPSILRDFAVDPFEAGRTSTFLFVFALLAFVRPRSRDFELAATFLPNFFLALFLLSPTGISRLSIGYIPMHALLAADGLDVVTRFLARNRERAAAALQWIGALAIAGSYIAWVWQPLREVRRHESPPVAAMQWIENHVPRGSKIYVQGGVSPFTEYFLTGKYKLIDAGDGVDPSSLPAERNAYYVADGASLAPDAINFRRPRKRLWALFHRRYFEVHIRPAGGRIEFGDGWYHEEGNDQASWRWMGFRSRTTLRGFGGRATLTLGLHAPTDVEAPPAITITLDKQQLDHFVPAEATFTRKYEVMTTAGVAHELIIEVDHGVNPAKRHLSDDSRDLGLQLLNLTWKALP